MPRYRLTLEYDGRPFVGWQRQRDALSVQAVVEAAAEALCGQACQVTAAGRTDAGVHARGQVAHLDLPQDYGAGTVRDALNHHVRPAPIAVLDAAEVAADFHARFDARERIYHYRLCDRRAPLALEQGLVWRVIQPLDVDAMRAGAAHLVGQHDFTTFRDSQCQAKSPIKSLDALEVRRLTGPDGRAEELVVIARARSFLHSQVRSMVGALVEVGRGAWTPDDVAAALAAKNRARCAPVAPPDGLYLMAVRYGA